VWLGGLFCVSGTAVFGNGGFEGFGLAGEGEVVGGGVVAVALGEGAVLKKHTTDVPATLIMVKGTVRFIIYGQEVVLKDLDTYQIPADVEHEVIGVEEENVFILTKTKYFK